MKQPTAEARPSFWKRLFGRANSSEQTTDRKETAALVFVFTETDTPERLARVIEKFRQTHPEALKEPPELKFMRGNQWGATIYVLGSRAEAVKLNEVLKGLMRTEGLRSGT